MNMLLAILDDGGSCSFEDIVGRLPAGFCDARDRVVLLHFSRSPQNVQAFRGHAGFRVETVVTDGTFGYGEQVKLAFALAGRLGLGTVVTVDGNLRYPLQDVPRLLAALEAGADLAVAAPAGEDISTRAGAWLATRLVNLLTRARLSAWHPGFRAYSLDALSGIPFTSNLDDRGFNTEILIQLLIAGKTITLVPTQGYAHEPLSLFARCRFAWGMLKAACVSLLHQCSLFYQPQFDLGPPLDAYALKLGYRSSHSEALAAIPPGSWVLDIGCGNGAFDRLLMERGCRVHGLDRHAAHDVTGLDAYTSIDLDVKAHAFPARGYDYVLLLDVLEHLRHPEALLAYLREQSGPQKPLLLLSVPNVAFFIIRLRLLCGSFQYGKLGILDLTHVRLFTEKSIRSLLERNGYRVESLAGIPAPYPKAIGRNAVSRALLAVNQGLIRLWRSLFSYQLLIVARPRPILDDLLPDPEPRPHA